MAMTCSAAAAKFVDDGHGEQIDKKTPVDLPPAVEPHDVTFLPVVIGDLTKDTRHIKNQFAKLAIATKRSLKSRGVLPDQLLEAIDPEIAPKCNSSSATVAEVFGALSAHMSFFHYEPLERVITEFEDQNVLKKLNDYKEAIDLYCRNPLRQLPPNSLTRMDQNHRKTNTTMVHVKLDAEWDNSTLADVRAFRQKIAKIFEIKESLLNLHSVEEGCILTKFLVPKPVAENLFCNGLNSRQKRELECTNVLQMVCYPYVSWSFKHVIDRHPQRRNPKNLCFTDKSSHASLHTTTLYIE